MIFLKYNKIILLIQDIYHALTITKFTVEKGMTNKKTHNLQGNVRLCVL